MIYICSDLHGRYDLWSALLAKLNLRSDDTLYILADVIDRGPEGVEMVQDIMARPNVLPILGNHELTAAFCLPWLLEEITDRSLSELDDTRLAALREWILNGGGPTLRGLKRISLSARKDILTYLREMDLYAQVKAGGRSFVLTHAGLNHFSPHRPLEDYQLTDFLFCRPQTDMEFWADRYLVYGHTPTRLLRQQMGEPPEDTILHLKMQIAIDCGCGFGGKLGCLCADTLEEFYVE